jgi:hypothetical protein
MRWVDKGQTVRVWGRIGKYGSEPLIHTHFDAARPTYALVVIECRSQQGPEDTNRRFLGLGVQRSSQISSLAPTGKPLNNNSKQNLAPPHRPQAPIGKPHRVVDILFSALCDGIPFQNPYPTPRDPSDLRLEQPCLLFLAERIFVFCMSNV